MEKLLVSLLKRKISRKGFIKLCLAGLGSILFGGIFPKMAKAENARMAKDIAIAHDLIVIR